MARGMKIQLFRGLNLDLVDDSGSNSCCGDSGLQARNLVLLERVLRAILTESLDVGGDLGARCAHLEEGQHPGGLFGFVHTITCLYVIYQEYASECLRTDDMHACHRSTALEHMLAPDL